MQLAKYPNPTSLIPVLTKANPAGAQEELDADWMSRILLSLRYQSDDEDTDSVEEDTGICEPPHFSDSGDEVCDSFETKAQKQQATLDVWEGVACCSSQPLEDDELSLSGWAEPEDISQHKQKLPLEFSFWAPGTEPAAISSKAEEHPWPPATLSAALSH